MFTVNDIKYHNHRDIKSQKINSRRGNTGLYVPATPQLGEREDFS